MALLQTPICDFGWKAVDFELEGTDGKIYSLAEVRGDKATLVMFICNHCPYVKAIIDRLVGDVSELQGMGMGAIAIMSNDITEYPEDSPTNMAKFAEANGFTFPYVIDRSQDTGRAYGAVCTPDFFGFNADMELQYRGRLDASKKDAAPADAKRDLLDAMIQIIETGKGPVDQIPSMGCSIKWRGDSAKDHS